jgi:hypothetical protein
MNCIQQSLADNLLTAVCWKLENIETRRGCGQSITITQNSNSLDCKGWIHGRKTKLCCMSRGNRENVRHLDVVNTFLAKVHTGGGRSQLVTKRSRWACSSGLKEATAFQNLLTVCNDNGRDAHDKQQLQS